MRLLEPKTFYSVCRDWLFSFWCLHLEDILYEYFPVMSSIEPNYIMFCINLSGTG